MTTLGSLVVERRIATIAEVDEALARQVVDGGDLVTCLLEVSLAPEAVLVGLLAEVMGTDAAPAGELPRASSALLALVPSALADRQSLYPMEEAHGVLRVALAEPLPQAVEEDLGFALGVHLRPCAAPLVRIRQALARDYGLPLEKRFTRLLAKLERRATSGPSELPPAAPAPAPAAPAPSAAAPAPSAAAAVAPSAAAAVAPSAAPVFVPIAPLQSAPKVPSAVVHHAPQTSLLTPPRALGRGGTWPGLPWPASDSRAPQSPLDAFATVAPPVEDARPASARVEKRPSTPLTRSNSPLPQALLASAARATASQLDRQRRRREPPANQALVGWARRALGNVIASDKLQEPRRGPLTPADAERRLLATVSGEDALAIFFAFAKQYFDYAALFMVHGDLAEGHDAAGAGARREQLRGVGVALDLPSILATARSRGAPTVKRLARTGLDVELRADLGRSPVAEVLVVPVMVRGRCVALLYGDDDERAVELDEVGEVIAVERLAAAALERILVRKKRAARGDAPFTSTAPPPPILAEPSTSGPPAPQVPERDPWSAPQVPERDPWSAPQVPERDAWSAPQVPERDPWSAPPPAIAAEPSTSTDAPALSPVAALAARPAEDADDDGAPQVMLSESSVGDEMSLQELIAGIDDYPPPFAPASAPAGSASVSAEAQLPPQSRHPYRDLPPVLIRPELVDQVVGGGERGERALGEILALGEAAIPSVFARFPGPLTVDRQKPIADLPRPADCGPVLRIVAAMRRLALPFLAVRSGDADVEVRFWATYLLGELNYADAGQALFARLFDESIVVRRIAVRAARNLLAAGDGGGPLRKSLERLVIYREEPEARRIAAIRALAELRIYRSVPALIAALTDPSSAVAESAAQALSIVTRVELGRDAKKWHDWWESKGQKRLS